MTILKDLGFQEIGCPAAEESPVTGGENAFLVKYQYAGRWEVNACHCLHCCHPNQVSKASRVSMLLQAQVTTRAVRSSPSMFSSGTWVVSS